MYKIENIEKEALWVIKHYGSPAGDKKKPGSMAKAQAKRIAEFVRQWDNAEQILAEHGLDLITIMSPNFVMEMEDKTQEET